MGCVGFRDFLSSLTMELFYFFAPFAFELLAMWGPSLPWSDLVIIPVYTCKEGTGVLMIWQQRLGHHLSTEFHLTKCIFNSSQGCFQVKNTSFTVL